jgi:protein SMG6
MSIQKRRSIPEAGTADLFLLLHGMIFTRIQLDDFDQVFDRLRERLEEDAHASRLHVFPQHDSISQSTWLTMAVINISAIMQYGSEEGYLRKTLAEESTHRKTSRAVTAADTAAPVNPPIGLTSVAGKMRAQEASEATTPGDSTFTASRIIPSANESASLENAARVTFLLLRHCFRYPVHSASAVNVLNPYITSMLTFLGTILRHAAVLAVFERFIPWLDMVQFMNSAPLQLGRQQEAEYKLIIGPPLPEDWCIRGMEWVGRRVFERGFWKARASHPKASNPLKELSEDIDGSQTSRIQNEMDVLLYTSENGLDHGGDNYESPMGVTEHIDAASSVTRRRWKRVLWSMSVITNCVDGLEMDGTSKQPVKIVKNGALDRNLQKWEQERNDSMMQERNRQRREEEARGEWSEDRDGSIGSDEEIEAETDHDPILANLGNRRRELLSVLAQTRQDIASAKTSKRVCSSLSPMELPGYTVLVFDTNVLLDALGPFARLYESGIWTLIIPLPGE